MSVDEFLDTPIADELINAFDIPPNPRFNPQEWFNWADVNKNNKLSKEEIIDALEFT